MAELSGTADAVFRRQVEAFNAHDLDAYLATYSPDAVVHGVREQPLRGADALRMHYRERLDDPTLQCHAIEVVSWPDGWLVAREQVTSAAGTRPVTALFRICDGVIEEAFIGV